MTKKHYFNFFATMLKNQIKEYKIQDIYTYHLPIPAVLWVPFWVGGLVVGQYFSVPFFVCLIKLLTSLVGAFFTKSRLYALFLISFLAGYLYMANYQKVPENHISMVSMSDGLLRESSKEEPRNDGKWYSYSYKQSEVDHIQQHFTGKIVSSAQKVGERWRYTLELQTMSKIDVSGRVYLVIDNGTLKYGDVISGGLRIVGTAVRNPGERDYSVNMRQNGVFGTAYTVSPLMVYDRSDEEHLSFKDRFYRYLYKIKDNMRSKLLSHLKYSSPTAISMVLGERQYLSEYADDFYSETLPKSGLMHIFAVSGLHIGIISLVLMTLFRLLPFGRVFPAVATILALIFYAFLCGLAPPIVRAVIFFSFFIIGSIIDIPLSKWQVLLMALFFISLINPLLLTSASLILSFLAFAGIILGQMMYANFIKHSKFSEFRTSMVKTVLFKVTNYFFILLGIQLMITPMLIYFFGTFNLNVILANFIGVLLIGLLLPLYFLVVMIPAWFVGFNFIVLTAEFLTAMFNQFAQMFSRFPFVFEFRQGLLELAFMLILLFIGLVFIAYHKNRKWLYQGFILCGLALCFMLKPSVERGFQLIFFDTGNADTMLIRFSTKDYMLIDTSEFDRNPRNISRNLVPYLKSENVSHLQKVLITHSHSDHYGGLFYLASQIQIDTLIVSQRLYDSALGQSIREYPHLMNTAYFVISDTLTYRHKNYTIKFFHPDKDYRSHNENNHSLVCRLTFADQHILFTGDIEQNAEDYILRKYPQYLDSHIMKAPHHGSRTSSSAGFLSSVSPELFVISASGNERRGFPSSLVLETARQYADRIYVTGNDGAVVVDLKKD